MKACGCPKGYPLIDSKVRHVGRCLLSDETLAAYKIRMATLHTHDYAEIRRCKTCGAEE